MSGEETIALRLDGGDQRTFLRTGIDLSVARLDGSVVRIPICYDRITLGSPGKRKNDIELDGPGVTNRQANLIYQEGKLYCVNQNNGLVANINGAPCPMRELADEDLIEIGGFKLRVVGLSEKVAFLEGYSEGCRDRTWGLKNEVVYIGRQGKRINHVELEDPTVSRTHAFLRPHSGTFILQAETSASPTMLNGEIVGPGAAKELSDGDLIQVGQQVMRFRVAKGKAKTRDLVPQEATILFSDVWNYSGLSEDRPLEETIRQMNEFYQAVGRVVESHGGVLMTFLGDAIMAVFGADKPSPEDPARAVAAGLAMQDRLADLNVLWEQQQKPTMRIGVGINTGEVMVGDIGFSGKLEFAAMGDNTNLAARLEKLTREFDAQVVMSGSTYRMVEGRFQVRNLGSTKVKGRQALVEVYEVLGPAVPA